MSSMGALWTLGACSVVDHVTSLRTSRLARRGIEYKQVDLGPDHIGYWSGGYGEEVVVFLHGFGGNALFQWSPQLEALAAHYTIVAPDLLWFGGSHSREPDYSVRHQAQAVLRLLDHEGIELAHVVGVSYGGMVTHQLLAAQPERFERVVLLASPARAFLADDKRELMAEVGVESVDELLLPRTSEDLRRLMSLAYFKAPRVPSFVSRQVIERFYTDQRPQQVRMLESLESSTRQLRGTYGVPEHPTLIVWGAHDRIFPERAAWRLHGELRGDTQVCVLDKAAHAPHLHRKRRVSRLIMTFLGGQPVFCRGRTVPLMPASREVDDVPN